MLTPQEVSEHAFTKASFGGYNMAMVDEFLDVLTADYTALYKENAVLKSKMKVLVDKVEEYRTTEDAMRKALLSAQRMADEMVQEAERKRDALLAEAEEAARVKIAGLRQEIDAEAHRLAVAKDNTADFLSKLNKLCAHEQDFLEKFAQIAASTQPVADPVVSAAEDIEASVAEAVSEDPAYVPQRVAAEVQAEFAHAAVAPQVDVAAPAEPVATAAAPVETLPETDAPGGLYDDIAAFAAQVKGTSGMQEQRFEITLGGPKAPPAAEAQGGMTTHEDSPVPVGAAPVDEPTKRIDFDHLQFGRDYEIK